MSVARRIVARIPKALAVYPFQAAMITLLTISALAILLGIGNSKALDTLGPQIIYGWALANVIGGPVTLIAMWAGFEAKSLETLKSAHRVETIGLSMIAASAVVYIIAILLVTGANGLVSCCILLAIVLACIVKILVLKANSETVEKYNREE